MMSDPAPETQTYRADKAAAIFLGLAVITVAFGPALLAVWLGLASILVFYRLGRVGAWTVILPDLGKPLGLALVATFAWWLLCSVLSIDPGKAASTWARTVGLVFLGYCLTIFLSRRVALIDLSLKTILCIALPVMAYIISVGFFDEGLIRFVEMLRGKPVAPDVYFKPFQSVTACLLPVFLWTAWRLSGLWRWVAVVMVVLGAFVLHGGAAQLSRSAVGGLAIASAFCFGLWLLSYLPVIARRAIVMATLASVIVGSIWFFDHLPRPPMNDRDFRAVSVPLPDPHRQVIWGFAADEIAKRPLFGTGMNTINLTPGAKQIHHPYVVSTNSAGDEVRVYFDLEYMPGHPHNWVLEVATENGLPGLGLMLVTVILLSARLVRSAYNRNAGAWTALAVTAVFLAGSLANFSFWSVWWQASYVILLAITWAATRCQDTLSG